MSRRPSEPRVATHLVSVAGSDVVHAAGMIPRLATYIVTCTGRAVHGAGRRCDDFAGCRSDVTCKSCLTALATGKAVWK